MPDYRATIERIASLIKDGDTIDGSERELSIDDAFATAEFAISLCRDALGTDGSNLPPTRPWQEV